MKLELTDKDVDNLKETIFSIFQTIYDHTVGFEEEAFSVERIDLSYSEWETLIKIAKKIFTQAEIYVLNRYIEIPEAKIK